MENLYQSPDPEIHLDVREGEQTLLIDGGQAMQAWERELMQESADLLCGYGSEFLEVGLGFGISAVRIATRPTTRKHVVLEKYQKVIDLFRESNPSLPESLSIRHADFFEVIEELESESVDGIFFDPYMPGSMGNDEALWRAVGPHLVRILRPGGAFVPCFSGQPVLRWQFTPFFSRIVVERRSYEAYATTDYMGRRVGDAYIQLFVKIKA